MLLGASTLSQLQDTLPAADVTLNSDELREIDALTTSPKPYPAMVLGKIAADAKITAALAATTAWRET